MSLHKFVRSLKYNWQAKGRHGTHSPFVYSFIENVLLDKSDIDQASLVAYPSIALRYENLMNRTRVYFHLKNVVYFSGNKTGKDALNSMIMLSENDPKQWITLFEEFDELGGSDNVVFVAGIHDSKVHSQEWQKLCNSTIVRMSIDLHKVGLLFFKKEFKEQQHFVLKY